RLAILGERRYWMEPPLGIADNQRSFGDSGGARGSNPIGHPPDLARGLFDVSRSCAHRVAICRVVAGPGVTLPGGAARSAWRLPRTLRVWLPVGPLPHEPRRPSLRPPRGLPVPRQTRWDAQRRLRPGTHLWITPRPTLLWRPFLRQLQQSLLWAAV